MSEQYVLTFNTAGGGTKTVRVPDPDTGISTGALNSAINSIISADLFNVSGGSLTSLRSALLHTTTRTVLI